MKKYTFYAPITHKAKTHSAWEKSLKFNAGILLFMLVAMLYLPVSAQTTSVTYATPGATTWVCPVGVTSVTIECWGAGGGGGRSGTGSSGQKRAGGGGGGGGYSSVDYTTIPGTTYNITVGLGGTSGIAGTFSRFNIGATVIARAQGGGAGGSGSSSGGTAGAGAILGTGQIVYSGGEGGVGSNNNGSGGGGGGAGTLGGGGAGGVITAGLGAFSNGGNGNVGRNTHGNGSDGFVYGGGGSGGYWINSGSGRNGGIGANGMVRISYPAKGIYRTTGSGNWRSASVWDISTDGGNTWYTPFTYPRITNSFSILIRAGHTISLDGDVPASNTTIESGGVLNIVTLDNTLTYASGTALTNNGNININVGGTDSTSSRAWTGDGLVIDGTLINNNSINIGKRGVMRFGNTTNGAVLNNYGTINNLGGYEYWDSGSNTDYHYGIDVNTSYTSTCNNYGIIITRSVDATATGYYRGNARFYHLNNMAGGVVSDGGDNEKRASSDVYGNFVNNIGATFNNNGNTEFASGGSSFSFTNYGIYNENWMTSFNTAGTYTNAANAFIVLGDNGCYRFNAGSTFKNLGRFINNNDDLVPGNLDGIVLNNGSANFNNYSVVINKGPIRNNGNFNTYSRGEFVYQANPGSIDGNYLRYYKNGILTYNGALAQTTSNFEFPSSTTYIPAYVKIDNTNGVSMHEARILNSKTDSLPTNGPPYLILANGGLILNQYTLTMKSNSASAISRINGFVVSEHKDATNLSVLRWNTGTATGNFIFPFGTMDATDNYIPVTIEKTNAASSDISISTRGSASDNLPLASGVTNLNSGGVNIAEASVIDRWWEITPTAVLSANITFTYRGAENTTATPADAIAVQHWTGALWNDGKGGGDMSYTDCGAQGVTSGTSSVTATGINQFSPFVLVLKKNPLPVELLGMSASCDGNKVNITWSTASETNNDYFTIERSVDVVNWEFVKHIPGSGTNNNIINYSTVDEKPRNGTSYYRLKQTDYNGQFEIFSPVAVICKGNDNESLISYYPNPFTSSISLKIQSLDIENALVTIKDVYGNVVYQKEFTKDNLLNNPFTLDPGDLAAGIYMVTFQSAGYTETDRIIKQ